MITFNFIISAIAKSRLSVGNRSSREGASFEKRQMELGSARAGLDRRPLRRHAGHIDSGQTRTVSTEARCPLSPHKQS